MNNFIREEYQRLPQVSREQLRRQFTGSPKMLRLLDLLEQPKKFGTYEAVHHVYEEDTEAFEVLRNRYFKLRKKLAEVLEQGGGGEAADAGVSLMPLEQEFYRCRTLVQNNHFQEARRRLEKLVSECWERNIFELLPDALNQMLFCNFAMNIFRDNKRVYDQLAEANSLLNSLNEQRLSARRAYEETLLSGYEKARPFVARLKTIALQHKNYPRFELYYQFTAFTLGTGSRGNDVRVLARHWNRVQELLKKYPDVPAAFYEPHSVEMMQSYLYTAQGFYAFQRGDVEECHRCFMLSWDIHDRTPGLRIRRTDSQFVNRIAIEVATGRFREALQTAEQMLEFFKDQREEEKRLKAYAEMVQVYTYAWPQLKPHNAEFLLGKLDEYIKVQRRDNLPTYGLNIGLKAVFLLQLGEPAKAARLGRMPETREGFERTQVPVYNEIFDLAGKKASPEKVEELRKNIQQLYGKAKEAGLIYALKRALALVDLLR